MEHKYRKVKTKDHDLKEAKKTIASNPKGKPQPGAASTWTKKKIFRGIEGHRLF
jgi:hypothetical protein